MVVEGLGFLVGFGDVVEFYADFKFTPSCLVDLVGGSWGYIFDCWVGVLMFPSWGFGDGGAYFVEDLVLNRGV